MRRLLVTLFALAAIAGAAPLFSGANFVVQTLNPQTATAAADFVAPTVASSVIADTTSGTPFDGAGYVAQGGTYRIYANVTDAGSPASGVATVTADVTSVSDGGHAAVPLVAGSFTVGGVTYNYASAEQIATTPLAAGSKGYTVSAVDNASNASSAASFSVTVDNTAPTIDSSTIARADGVAPGYVRQGDSYYVYANASDVVSGIHDVTANVNAVTTGQTAAALTTTGGPWTVKGVSYAYRSASLTAIASLTDGSKAYSIGARDNATNAAGPSSFSVVADSTAPTVSITAPASNAIVRATITPAATATDANGITAVTIQRSPTGAGIWTDICTDTTSPYSCSLDTASLADGLYDFRAVATDAAGNTATSTSTGVRVDNTAPAVTMAALNSPLSGTVTLQSSSATDGGTGVASVKYQYAPTGTSTWTDACTGTTSPSFSCSFDTMTVGNGNYDFRAVATDTAGNTGTSATISNRQVSNSPHGVSFTTSNCTGCTSGMPEPGDTISFTYNQAMDPGSIVPATTSPSQPAWDGVSARSVEVLIKASTDSLTEIELDVSGTVVNLGSVDLGANYVNGNGSLTFSSSPIVTPDKKTFTITLGSGIGCVGASSCTAGARQAGPGTGVWTPSTSAKSAGGASALATTVSNANFTAF